MVAITKVMRMIIIHLFYNYVLDVNKNKFYCNILLFLMSKRL